MLSPIITEYTFSSEAYVTFPQIEQILAHKAYLKNAKQIYFPCFIISYSAMKLKMNDKRNHRKYANVQRLTITFLNTQQVIEEINEKFKHFLESNSNTSIAYQNLWDTMKVFLRKKLQSCECPYQKMSSSKQPNYVLPGPRKTRQTRYKASKTKEIVKIRVEIY